jgi:hypothetical protein
LPHEALSASRKILHGLKAVQDDALKYGEEILQSTIQLLQKIDKPA